MEGLLYAYSDGWTSKNERACPTVTTLLLQITKRILQSYPEKNINLDFSFVIIFCVLCVVYSFPSDSSVSDLKWCNKDMAIDVQQGGLVSLCFLLFLRIHRRVDSIFNAFNKNLNYGPCIWFSSFFWKLFYYFWVT